MAKELTQERLKELLHYDAMTGEFTWKVYRGGKARVGTIASYDDGQGYIRIKIDGTRYKAHRLAFLYMTGEWPKDQVDHIDGCRSNNAFKNLREATERQNSANRRRSVGSYSGFKGVSFNRKQGNYSAQIKVNGKLIRLGRFNTPEAAHAAYCEAAKHHFGEFMRAGLITGLELQGLGQ